MFIFYVFLRPHTCPSGSTTSYGSEVAAGLYSTSPCGSRGFAPVSAANLRRRSAVSADSVSSASSHGGHADGLVVESGGAEGSTREAAFDSPGSGEGAAGEGAAVEGALEGAGLGGRAFDVGARAAPSMKAMAISAISSSLLGPAGPAMWLGPAGPAGPARGPPQLHWAQILIRRRTRRRRRRKEGGGGSITKLKQHKLACDHAD